MPIYPADRSSQHIQEKGIISIECFMALVFVPFPSTHTLPPPAGSPQERHACPVRAVLLGGRHRAATPDEAADRDDRAGASGGRGEQEGTDHRGRVRGAQTCGAHTAFALAEAGGS